MHDQPSGFWGILPLLVVPYASIASTLGVLTVLPQARPDLVVTAAIPCAILALVLAARWRRAGVPFPWFRWVAWSAALPAATVLACVIAPPLATATTDPEGVLWGYEITNLVLFSLLATHCWMVRGGWGFAVLVVVALTYGMCLESMGIVMGVFNEPGYHWHVPGFAAPLATMLGWVTVFYPCMWMLDTLRRGFPVLAAWPLPVRAAVLALLAVGIDLQVDPYATALGLWTWHPVYAERGVAHWFGVPLVNFAAWFAAVSAFGLFADGWAPRLASAAPARRFLASVLAVPSCLLASGIIVSLALLVVEGPGGPSWALLASPLR